VLLRPPTGERRTISPTDIRGRSASIAPDGTQYVYTQYNPSLRRREPHIVNINGTNPQKLEALFSFAYLLDDLDDPAWSPNGQYIAFTADKTPDAEGFGRNVFIFFRNALDTPEEDTVVLELDLSADGSSPAWSQDSTRLVFASDFTPSGSDAVELDVYDLTTESFTLITSDGTAIIEAQPDWSPDNTRIVFSGRAEGTAGSDIYVVPADGSEPSQLLFDFGQNDTDPVWSPDGRWIAFTSDRDGGMDVYIYDTQTEAFYAATSDPMSFDSVSDWIP
jgi:Tol biopolymer transport system component